MAVRLATRETAIMATLRVLEAVGRIHLIRDAETLRALPTRADGEEIEDQAESLRQAREPLGYLLAEIAAYRRAYRTRPVEELFPAPERR
jgi:hypothetical protein